MTSIHLLLLGILNFASAIINVLIGGMNTYVAIFSFVVGLFCVIVAAVTAD